MQALIETGLRPASETTPPEFASLGLEVPAAWDYRSDVTPATEESLLSYIWNIFWAIITCEAICGVFPVRQTTPRLEMRAFTCRSMKDCKESDIAKIIRHVRSPYETSVTTNAVLAGWAQSHTTNGVNFCLEGRTVESFEKFRFTLSCSYNNALYPDHSAPSSWTLVNQERLKARTSS